jgi:hypothetical protein
VNQAVDGPAQKTIRGNLSSQVLRNAVVSGEDHSKSRIRPLRLVGAIAFAALGFVGTCFLVRTLIQAPISLYAEVRSEKLALAKQWAAKASIAAFGSSHVDCGFDPRNFDKSLSPTSSRPLSINLGVLGGVQIEDAAIAREYVRLSIASPAVRAPAHILLMEININVNFNQKMLTHPRSIYIYDLNALRLAKQFSDPKLGVVRAAGRSAVALFEFALNFINMGMLSDQIFHPPLNRAILESQSAADRRGLSPPSVPPTDQETREMRAFIADLRAAPVASAAELTPGLCAEATSLLPQSTASDGYHLIYIVTPKLSDLSSYSTYPDTLTCGRLSIPIVNVAQPPAHPELYEPGLWHDMTHLNERGAGVYSRLLGLAVKQVLNTETLAAL